jgi:hypothetical protein
MPYAFSIHYLLRALMLTTEQADQGFWALKTQGGKERKGSGVFLGYENSWKQFPQI